MHTLEEQPENRGVIYFKLYIFAKAVALIVLFIMVFTCKIPVPKCIPNINSIANYNYITAISMWTLMGFNHIHHSYAYGSTIEISVLVSSALEFIIFISNTTITICIGLICPGYASYLIMSILSCYVIFSIILIILLKKYKCLRPRITWH